MRADNWSICRRTAKIWRIHAALYHAEQPPLVFQPFQPSGVATDIPAAVRRKPGKGELIWCAMPVEMNLSAAPYRVFMNLLRLICPEPGLRTDAARIAEIVVMKDASRLCVSAVRPSNEFDGTLPAFEIRIKAKKASRRVMIHPDESRIPFAYANGWTSFTARALDFLTYTGSKWNNRNTAAEPHCRYRSAAPLRIFTCGSAGASTPRLRPRRRRRFPPWPMCGWSGPRLRLLLCRRRSTP